MKLLKGRYSLSRRGRLVWDGVVLLLSLLLLVAALDFPIPTAELARRATERRSFFGPSQVLGVVEDGTQQRGRQVYAVRWGDWYGLVTVYRDGLFWETGGVDAVEQDPAVPLVSTTPAHEFRFSDDPMCVFSGDPAIVRVTVEVPVWAVEFGTRLYTYTQDAPIGNCFLFRLPVPGGLGSFQYSSYRLSGYDAAGDLVWRSPTPESWTEQYQLYD